MCVFLSYTFTHIYTQKENAEKNKLYPVITYLLYTQIHAYPCMHMHIYTDISFSGFGFGGMVEWWDGGMGEFGELPNVPELTVNEAQKKQEET